jgi:hypothetical protein
MLNTGFHSRRAGARRAAVGAVAGFALVLAGCGGDGDDTDSMDDTTTTVTEQDDDAADDTGSMEDDETDGAESDEDAEPTEEDADDAEAELADGVYRAYSEDALAEPGYDTNVIFFHASWCPECRAFEQAIESEVIPDGVQILKADYDTEEDLKQRYEVQIQTTFVKVDADGEELSSWVGYEKDRSVDTILRELG